jgi:xylulokinase
MPERWASAMLTGIASGCFRDLSEASKCWSGNIRTYAPRKEMHEQYMEIYGRYRELYQTVRKLMKN